MRELRCAIDSEPLGNTPFDTFDHSGLQLMALTTRPLGSVLEERPVTREDRIGVRVSSDGRWRNGTPIMAEDYARGFKALIERTPFLRRVIFRKLRSIETLGDNLTLALHRPNYRIEEALRLPNWVPISPAGDLDSGRMYLESQTSGERLYRFRDSRDLEMARVLTVKSPEENVTLFEEARLDITADTAFPFERLSQYDGSPALKISTSGIFGAITFGGGLVGHASQALRKSVGEILRPCTFDEISHGAYRRVDTLHQGAEDISRETTESFQKAPQLTLAYDPFYPNREIAFSIRETLRLHGFDIQCVEDDFYAPAVNADFRLSLLRGLVNTPFFRFAGQLFNPCLAGIPSLQREYAANLDRLESEPDPSILDSYYERLSWILSEAGALVPLFEIPSLYLSRVAKNPLLYGTSVPPLPEAL